MATDKKQKAMELFDSLPESAQNSALDFLAFLAQKQEETWESDNTPLSDEEKEAIAAAEQEIAKGELVDWEDIKREFNI